MIVLPLISRARHVGIEPCVFVKVRAVEGRRDDIVQAYEERFQPCNPLNTGNGGIFMTLEHSHPEPGGPKHHRSIPLCDHLGCSAQGP